MSTTLGIFVRQPVPGQVKTRLAAELGDESASRIYAAFIADLADRFRFVAAKRHLCISPATLESRRYFVAVAREDYHLWPQPDADLGGRMQSFFDEHIQEAGDRVVLIGSD